MRDSTRTIRNTDGQVNHWEYDQLEDQTMAGEMILWDNREAGWTGTAKARESWSTLTQGYFLLWRVTA